MKAVLFDLEGTLVETVYARSSPELVDRERREVKKEIIRLGVPEKVLGDLVRHTLLRNRAFDWVDTNLAPRARTRFYAQLDAFMKDIERWSAKQAVLYPDTLETLSRLATEGFEMGLVTNTSREAADYMLKNLGLGQFFSVIITRNDVPRLKPHSVMIKFAIATMRNAVEWLIGDAVYDAEAARSSDLKSIIVRRDGKRPPFKHDCFVKSLLDTLSIVL